MTDENATMFELYENAQPSSNSPKMGVSASDVWDLLVGIEHETKKGISKVIAEDVAQANISRKSDYYSSVSLI
tara:strand:+ start:17847 stop:18065 length:219 start_codon:yes stop_codon:yes gene_type:complete